MPMFWLIVEFFCSCSDVFVGGWFFDSSFSSSSRLFFVVVGGGGRMILCFFPHMFPIQIKSFCVV